MFEHGELVQIWDAFYEEYVNLPDALIPEHGKIGVIVHNSTLNPDYRYVLIDGTMQVFHVDHLRDLPR